MFKHRSEGFSLIEMMVVLVILAISLLLAGPAFTDLIRDNRLVSSVYCVRGDAQSGPVRGAGASRSSGGMPQ